MIIIKYIMIFYIKNYDALLLVIFKIKYVLYYKSVLKIILKVITFKLRNLI